MTHPITPFLWFDTNAEEATAFYTSIFQNTEAHSGTSFRLDGQEFLSLNGGPHYHFTPAISFYVLCETETEIDELWARLNEGGTALMELAQYPFSKKFGWVQDRFGLSWQLSLAEVPQTVNPFLMFVGDQYGRAEEAINFYLTVFPESRINHIERYPASGSASGSAGGTEKEGGVMFSSFTLNGTDFMASENGYDHNFTFSEATSFFVSVQTQEEVDTYWEKLTAGGAPGQCGWLKDRFGVSWQVIPEILGQYLQDADREKANRVIQAMLRMTKIDIAGLEAAYSA
ncbi:MAG TPA: VOC family protein [Thermomicrobiales bacterium]|nr:VOC family protein [Thermomicrobiales bacterium]